MFTFQSRWRIISFLILHKVSGSFAQVMHPSARYFGRLDVPAHEIEDLGGGGGGRGVQRKGKKKREKKGCDVIPNEEQQKTGHMDQSRSGKHTSTYFSLCG